VINNKGAVFENMGNIEAALTQYLLAIRVNAEFSDSYYNAAKLYCEQGLLELAENYLNSAIQKDPSCLLEAIEDDKLGWLLDIQEIRDAPAT
jgi:tetratricopeptide (TPR) repeat protein